MSKKKKASIKIRLASTAETGYYYTAKKNSKFPRKLEFRKYDPVARKHVLFVEKKIK